MATNGTATNGTATNGTATNGTATNGTPATPVLSTQPAENQNWQITLKDKVIAITGANRGIGLGIAEVCLANGAKMVYSMDLMDPSEDFAELSKKYRNFKYIQMDVTSEESVTKAIDGIVEAEGAIHGLVANAGMTKHQPALEFSRAQVEQLFNLNVSSISQSIQQVLPLLEHLTSFQRAPLTRDFTRSSALSSAPKYSPKSASRSASKAASSSPPQ